MRAAQTASVIECPNAHGPTFVAQVRELDDRRTYLQRWPTREAALAACAEYIATGRRPPKQPRGPKRGQKQRTGWANPPALMPLDTPAKPLPTAELIARIAAKHPASRPPLPPQSPPTVQHSGTQVPEVPRANSATTEDSSVVRPRATWREIASRFA